MHIFSCQPSSGGDSGRNTQSAPQAKALTRARYLFGKSTDSVRLRPGTHSSETALGSLDKSVQWEPQTPAGGRGGVLHHGAQSFRGTIQIVSTHTYPQCLPITSRTKVLWWLEKRQRKDPLTTPGNSMKSKEESTFAAR